MSAKIRTFALVWLALILLLAMTVGAAFLPLGPAKPFISIAIAIAKASLIFWFFMHLREDTGLLRLAAVGGALWLLILLLLMSSDLLTRT